MSPEKQSELREEVARLVMNYGGEGGVDFGADPNEFLNGIEATVVILEEARKLQKNWIDLSRRSGLSWTQIGDLLGITKQSAQQKFRSDDEESQPENLEIRSANAFNEMGIAKNEGLKGNELVRVGFATLVFKKSDVSWEYNRIVSISPKAKIKELGAEGWQYFSSWFPYHYFKRPI